MQKTFAVTVMVLGVSALALSLGAVESIRLPEMVLVEAGTFTMGSDEEGLNAGPAHPVTLTRDFEMSRFLVSHELYARYCENSGRRLPPLSGRDADPATQPLRGASWLEAVRFCDWLSREAGYEPCYAEGAGKCNFDANGFRLPTEAEWEFAARGGLLSQGFAYAGSNYVDEVAWYVGNSGGYIHPVGQKAPNELGIHDMSGNYWVWCWDWFEMGYYAESPAVDPTGPSGSREFGIPNRVRRGGSFQESAGLSLVVNRGADGPEQRVQAIRLVRTVASTPD